jgi:NAD(P)-dependent dehydrogenase (short-subunit alcohol dehydrogenase family)
MQYRGKVVIVTGASSGIGHDAARRFAHMGATIVGVARKESLLKRLVDECRPVSPASSYLCGDLGERAFAKAVIENVVKRARRRVRDQTGPDIGRRHSSDFRMAKTAAMPRGSLRMPREMGVLSTCWT